MRRMVANFSKRALKLIPPSVAERVANQMLLRTGFDWKLKSGLISMDGSLASLQMNGFMPKTVIDVGAYRGEWTRSASRYFPNSKFHMIEAQEDKEPALRAMGVELNGRAALSICLLGAEPREASVFYQQESGSSALSEMTNFPRKAIELPMRTLDWVVEQNHLEGPYFLKLDVQGYELEVLKGGLKTLAQSEAVLLETSLLEYNNGAPLFHEVISYMVGKGFVMYDLCGLLRRETDRALFQCDVLLTKFDGQLRSPKKFWLNEPDLAR